MARYDMYLHAHTARAKSYRTSQSTSRSKVASSLICSAASPRPRHPHRYLGPAVNRQPGLRRERLAELTNILGKEQPATQTKQESEHYNTTTQVKNFEQQPDATNQTPNPANPNTKPPIPHKPKSRKPSPAQLSQT